MTFSRMFWRQSAPLLGLFLGLAVLDTWAQGKPGAKTGPPPALVKVTPAQQRELAPTVWVAGTVVSHDDARLAAEVDGKLIFVADIGTRAKPGDVVARLDETELSLAHAEARAVAVRDKARLDFARLELKRLTDVADKGLITRNRLDQAHSARDAAQGEWQAAKARLDRVADRLSRTKLLAPFPGVVASRLRRTGERVAAGDPILRLVNPESLEVVAQVAPDSLPHLAVGTRVRLQNSPRSITGTVRSRVPVGDDRSHLYDIRISLDQSVWPAGTAVRVAMPTAKPRSVVAVPRDALVLRRQGVSVFRATAEDKAERVSVKVGMASGEWIEVIGDIKSGDRVVVRGSERLRPGQALRFMPGKTKASKPPPKPAS